MLRTFRTMRKEIEMFDNPRRLRQPEERVGKCSNAALPPPDAADVEKALVQRVRRFDEGAIRILYDRHAHAMHHLALQFVRRTEDAEDIVQETWLAALAGIDRFEGRSSFKTWLFAILVNRARSRAKRDARTIPFSTFSETDQSRFESTPETVMGWDGMASPSPADELTLSAELRSVLMRAIDSLPELQRLVITLRDVEGWSAADVCEILGITHANARVLLHRARMKVRAALVPYLRTGVGTTAVTQPDASSLAAAKAGQASASDRQEPVDSLRNVQGGIRRSCGSGR
jgi:RNA polymerase sigma-70 factor, ECF subfamily